MSSQEQPRHLAVTGRMIDEKWRLIHIWTNMKELINWTLISV